MISLLALTAVLLSVTFVTTARTWTAVLCQLALALAGLLLLTLDVALGIASHVIASVIIL